MSYPNEPRIPSPSGRGVVNTATSKAQDFIFLDSNTIIHRYEIELSDRGFSFEVDSELDAYRSAYVFRNKRTKVVFAKGVQRWMVFVDDN